MMEEKIFLETTIQVDRNFSEPNVRKNISEKLKDKKLISSTYVLGEIKSNLLQNAITFYNLLQECETTSEAIDRLSSVIYSDRQYSRVLKIFANLAEDNNMNIKDLKKRLDMLIEDLFESRFFNNLEMPLINDTKCIRADAVPIKTDGLWKLERKCNAKINKLCNIENIHQSEEENIEKIENVCLNSKNKNLNDIANILKEIRNDGKKPLGRRCWKIGDLVICLESPDRCKIYTTNIKDYKPLCDLLDKELL